MASVGLETLEAPLLRVPFESLKRAAKDRKALIDEVSECVAALKHPLCPPSSSSAVPGPAAGTGPATARGNTPYGTPPLSLSLTPGSTAAPTPAGTPMLPDPMTAGAEAGAGAGAAAGGTGGGAEDTEMADASEVNLSLAPGSGPDEAQAGGSRNCREASIERLRLLLSQLQGVKRKLADVSRSEQGDSQRCKARLEHLASTGPIPKNDPRLIPWTRQRLDIILVDHLLRLGHHETANRLAAAAGIELLTDANIFEGARRVVNALLNDHSCEPALAWCAENRARLRKAKSQLEFKLHVQQFIELVRREERLAAIAYARANLASWASSHMAELQRAVATLAFTARTRLEVYKSLFDDAQWQSLADMFMRDLYKLHALTPEPLLHVYLQAGLSALRTPNSGEPGGSREDPLSLPAFQRLASSLPYAKHTQSKLRCAVTRELMSDANPPLVLPNGLVYSTKGVELLVARFQQQQAVQQGQQGQEAKAPAAAAAAGGAAGAGGSTATAGAAAAAAKSDGCFVCPRTGNVYNRSELRRAFVV